MIIIFIVAFLMIVLGLLVIAMAIRGRAPSAHDAEILSHQIQAVDVFELLALADDLAALRRNPGQGAMVKEHYRAVRRELLQRIKEIAINAAIVLRIAQFARHDQRAAEVAEQLIDDALSVRLLAFALIWRLHTMWLFPGFAFKAGGVIFFYQRLIEHLSWLSSRLQPTVVVDIR